MKYIFTKSNVFTFMWFATLFYCGYTKQPILESIWITTSVTLFCGFGAIIDLLEDMKEKLRNL